MKPPRFDYACPATLAEAHLNGSAVDEAALLAVANLPASAAYRRALVATLTERALRRAAS